MLRLTSGGFLTFLIVLLVGCSSAPTPPEATKPATPATKPGEPANRTEADSGAKTDETPSAVGPIDRKVVAAFLIRSGGTPYQSLRYLEALSVPVADVPGVQDIGEYIALTGHTLPPKFLCLERLTEVMLDNLGQKIHTLVSYRAFVEPIAGQTMAFDMASTDGGVPQRTIGHRTKNGVRVLFFRGGEQVESKDIDFQPGVEILPIGMDFIHVYFLQHPERKEFMRQFFVPDILGFADLLAKPDGTEMVPIGGRNYECAKYLVRTGSSRARSGVGILQNLWFDKQRKTLVRHIDQRGEADRETVGERVEPDRLKVLEPLVVRPVKPAVDRPFPYPLDRELLYSVRMGDQMLGDIRITFSKQPADEKGPAGWRVHTQLHLSIQGQQGANRRQEEAVTRFDEQFLPLDYMVTGFETAEVRADYTVHAGFADSQVTLRLRREIKPQSVFDPAVPVTAQGVQPAGTWDEPLRRVSLDTAEEGAEPVRGRVQNERFRRLLSAGTYVFDYHRIEHVAAAVYRLPFPPRPADPKAETPTMTQSVAFFAVRQNQSALVPLVIVPEPRDKDADPKDPVCYVAASNHMFLPGQILLDDKGRVLQWTTRYGTQEIVYTLDDAVMRKRERRGLSGPGQEGPLLLRPPWY